MAIHREAGKRVHALIAAAVADPGPTDIEALSRRMWRIDPVGGSIRAQVRMACSSKASLYMRRLCPPEGWELLGSEVPVGAGVADLVWRHAGGDVFIDEIKSGSPGIDSPKVRNQVLRLAEGGRVEWADRFLGVRLVQLRAPGLTAIWRAESGRLVKVGDERLGVR
jgi:hypothetical protein